MDFNPPRQLLPSWHHRLSVRLGAGVVLILVLALAAAGIWVGRQEHRRFEEQHGNHAAQVSKMVARALSERMLAGGGASVWRDVSEVAGELRAAVGATRILVLSRGGLVKATTDPLLEGHRFDREKDPECVDCHGVGARRFPSAVLKGEGERRLLRVVGAIEKLPGCLACHKEPETFRGMIAIDFDLSGLQEAARSRERFLVAIGAVAAAGTLLLIGLLLRTLVHAPIAEISRSAQELGAGNLGARIRVRRPDELGLLTGEFNRMAGRIQEEVDRIETSRREMELLYNLVVEVSQNLEVDEVRGAVLKVLRASLPFRRLLFCVEAAERSWSTQIVESGAEDQVFSGGGEMAAVIAGPDAGIEAALPGVPATLVREACAGRAIVQASAKGAQYLVLPFEHRGRIAGVLVASHAISDGEPEPDARLLHNLSVHIGLALENSFNFAQSITDGLTGLANKRHGLVRLEEALYLARRHGIPVGLMLIDIDFFKKVNDAHGHLAGDRVLREVASRLRAVCRSSDLVVRYGGEEFMVVLTHAPATTLAELGERYRRCVESGAVPVDGSGKSLAVTVSVGVTSARGPDSAEALIGRADRALYAAKREGRNRVVISAEGPGE